LTAFFPTLLWEFYNVQNEQCSLKGDTHRKVHRNILLLLACLVWRNASFNILRFGCNFAEQALDDRKNEVGPAKKCSVTINLIYQQGAINYASNRRNCF